MKPEAIQLLSSAGVFGPAIIVPVILKDDLGASEATIGVVAGMFAVAGFASSYIFGRAADVYGRRTILLIGLVLSGLATMLQVASLTWGGLEFFAGVRVVIGFCSGIFPAALLVYAYDAKVKMGWFSSFGAAGWGVGNLAVGMFGAFYEGAYLFSAGILFVSFAIALLLPFPKEIRMRVPLFPAALIRRNAAVYSAMLIRHTGANMIWVTYPLFLMSIGADELWIGIIYAFNAFGQFFFMNYSDRFDPSLLVAVGLGSSALTFFTFTLVGSYWEIIPSQVLLAVSWGFLYAGSLRYVMDRNPEKATATGLLSSTMSISGIIGPVIGGVAALSLGFKATIAIASAMAAVSLVIFLVELRRSGELNRLREHFRVRA
ncbi:MAG: hypothetical protein A3K67_03215 [Euryarchaeota archaeon RBG_16_62_10]|nr:MAG: hypothetical protein A3K67_03215 [Euryarchaeota archaeon RBG_16_62_10]